MTCKVIQGNFFPEKKLPKITHQMLVELTNRVMEETNVVDVMTSYTTYCIDRALRPSRRVHFDWAHEMLGTEFVQDVRVNL